MKFKSSYINQAGENVEVTVVRDPGDTRAQGVMQAVESPASARPKVARSPAPPAPTTTTS